MAAEPLFTDDELEAARVLFAGQASFMMGAVKMDGLPDAGMPEVCFAGRSNVGKSSLINALVGHKKLARASNEPGRTREINFFLLNDRIRLVDLPGYGFARVSRQTANKFQDLGRQYLRGRPNLKRVYLLIDARHGLKEVDKEALDALDVSAVSYQIVLTKADKIKPAEAAALVQKTQAQIIKRPAAFPRVLATSAEKGDGLPELRAEIKAVCEV
ncbi:MAG: ribosome biogenesis GTP-binding protein YihA/YsxC [Caulobacter sp.]|nr:ribosome biogenesis GTP-binding protein YihA/YsxC [Caulobacter sp.]